MFAILCYSNYSGERVHVGHPYPKPGPVIPYLARNTLPAETSEPRRHLLHFSPTEPRHNAETVLKNCGLFVYEDVNCVTNSVC